MHACINIKATASGQHALLPNINLHSQQELQPSHELMCQSQIEAEREGKKNSLDIHSERFSIANLFPKETRKLVMKSFKAVRKRRIRKQSHSHYKKSRYQEDFHIPGPVLLEVLLQAIHQQQHGSMRKSVRWASKYEPCRKLHCKWSKGMQCSGIAVVVRVCRRPLGTRWGTSCLQESMRRLRVYWKVFPVNEFPAILHRKALCNTVTIGHERDLPELLLLYVHSTEVEATS